MATSSPRTLCAAAAALLSLAGCAVAPPSGPAVVALPGTGKSYEQFASEDAVCKQAAAAQTGPAPSAEQSTNATVGSAVIGTALGAAAGAAIGSASGAAGGGAAVGGALGLLTGTAIGAGNAQRTSGNLQYRYDTTYTQCMMGHGNTVQQPPQVVQVYTEPAYGYYGGPVFIGGYYGYGPRYYRRY